MTHTLYLYQTPWQPLLDAIAANDTSVVSEVCEKASLDSNEKECLLRILRKEYERDPDTWEHPDGQHLVRAFAALCRYFANKTATIELYEDEDESRLLWFLCWDEWDGDDPFQIPLSPHGCPSVTFHGPDRLTAINEELQKVRAQDNSYSNHISDEELTSLIEFIDQAIVDNQGVFAHIEY